MVSLLLVIRDFVDRLGPDVDEHVTHYLSDVVREDVPSPVELWWRPVCVRLRRPAHLARRV
jgi:hypothetical protein